MVGERYLLSESTCLGCSFQKVCACVLSTSRHCSRAMHPERTVTRSNTPAQAIGERLLARVFFRVLKRFYRRSKGHRHLLQRSCCLQARQQARSCPGCFCILAWGGCQRRVIQCIQLHAGSRRGFTELSTARSSRCWAGCLSASFEASLSRATVGAAGLFPPACSCMGQVAVCRVSLGQVLWRARARDGMLVCGAKHR